VEAAAATAPCRKILDLKSSCWASPRPAYAESIRCRCAIHLDSTAGARAADAHPSKGEMSQFSVGLRGTAPWRSSYPSARRGNFIAWHRMASHGIAWHRMALTGRVSRSRTWSLWATPLDGPRSRFVAVTSVGSRKPVVAYPWQQFSRLSWSISPCRPSGVHVHESVCGPWTHLRYAP